MIDHVSQQARHNLTEAAKISQTHKTMTMSRLDLLDAEQDAVPVHGGPGENIASSVDTNKSDDDAVPSEAPASSTSSTSNWSHNTKETSKQTPAVNVISATDESDRSCKRSR